MKNLTRGQQRGLLVLLVAVVCFVGWRLRSAYLAEQATPPQVGEIEADATKKGEDGYGKSEQKNGKWEDKKGRKSDSNRPKVHVDLNAADEAELQTVRGIGPYFAKRIAFYRTLIGGYVDTEQIIKVGISPENFVGIGPQVFVDTTGKAYRELKRAHAEKWAQPEFANLPDYPEPKWKNAPDNNYNTQNDPDPSDSVPPAPLGFTRSDDRAPASPPPASPIDLNRADSLTLLKVPGIGPYTAGRILSYRKWLLFFQSVEQLREFRAIRPENFERMAPHLTVGPDFSAFPHIRINEATVEELAAHKYIDWKSARILVAYRGQHGPFQALADLEKVLALPPDLLPKLDGYLAF